MCIMCHCDKISDKSNLRREGCILAHTSAVVRTMGKAWLQEREVGGQIASTVRRLRVMNFAARSLHLFTQSRTPAHGTAPPTCTVGLPTSLNLIWKIPHGHGDSKSLQVFCQDLLLHHVRSVHKSLCTLNQSSNFNFKYLHLYLMHGLT